MEFPNTQAVRQQRVIMSCIVLFKINSSHLGPFSDVAPCVFFLSWCIYLPHIYHNHTILGQYVAYCAVTRENTRC